MLDVSTDKVTLLLSLALSREWCLDAAVHVIAYICEKNNSRLVHDSFYICEKNNSRLVHDSLYPDTNKNIFKKYDW